MLESDVHYLHQFAQVKEDAVDLDRQPDDGMCDEVILSETIRQAAEHLQTIHPHKHTQRTSARL